MKKLFTFLFALVLLALPACTGNSAVEPATIPETVPVVESVTIPETVPEVTEDPFLMEDEIVDSTQDIVIDFAAFVEERNAVHRTSIEEKFTDEFIKTNGPDFHEDLDLVSEEEAALLQNTPINFYLEESCAKEDILEDVDLLFRVFESFYGPYYYYGGDETFGAAKARIEEEINAASDRLTLEEMIAIVSKNLSFIKDRHMNIGPELLCETNKIAVHDYYVKDLWFYEDDVGYYTKKEGRKWYLSLVGSDENVSEYLKITIDEKGQLCYMVGLTVPVDNARLTIDEITLRRGERTAFMPIVWTEFSMRSHSLEETVTVKDGIPLLETVPRSPYHYTSEELDAQQNRLRKMGKDFLSQDVVIVNLNSGCGWQSLFESIDHQIHELTMYKLSKTAEQLDRWMMPWQEGDYGEYVTWYFSGKWGKNDTLVFAVHDRHNFSAGESTISDIRSIENVVLVGGSTGGTAGPSAATNKEMVLPKTRLLVHFGASLTIHPGYTEDGYCFAPDIWVDPNDAVDAIYRMCQFYGITNNADTAVLDKYMSTP